MSWLVKILGWLQEVPNVVWAAVIAAGIAFITTILTNRNSRMQLRMQLDHTAQQRDRERSLALRREVYLPAAEAMTQLQGVLGQLGNVDLEQSELQRQIATHSAALSKINLVASNSTVIAVMEYLGVVTPIMLKLLEMRLPIVVRKRLIDQQRTFADAAIAEHGRFLAVLKQYNLEGGKSQAEYDRVTLQCKNELELHRKYSEELQRLWKAQCADILSIAQVIGEDVMRTAQLVPNIVLSARRDLDMPIDEKEFRERFAEQIREARKALEETINNLSHGMDTAFTTHTDKKP